MKLFHGKRTRSLRVVWMLEEMGLDYELEVVAFPATTNPAVLAFNPLGTLPTFVDGDVVMTESNAILEYLGRRYGPTPLVPEVGSAIYPAYLDYLHYGESTLAAQMSHLVRTRFFAPDDQKQNWTVQTIGDTFVSRALDFSRVLDSRAYAAGDVFTAADISMSYALNFGVMMKLGDRYPANLTDYLARTQARDAYVRAAEK